MELQRLAEEVLVDGLPARGRDISPLQESFVLHGLTSLCSLAIQDYLAARLAGLILCALCICHLRHFLLFRLCLAHLQCGACFLLGQHEGLVLPHGGTPQQGRRQDHRQQQILRAEEVLQIHEEAAHKHLDAIAQRHAGCDVEHDCRLPPLELAPLLDAYP